jgi:hypothetical protein
MNLGRNPPMKKLILAVLALSCVSFAQANKAKLPAIDGTPTPGQCAVWVTDTKVGGQSCAAASETPDADAATKGKIQLAGDLGGTAASPTVPGLATKSDADHAHDGMTSTIANGTASLGTDSISANTCATVVTVAASGVATNDVIQFTPNADITGVTGYTPAGTLSIFPYPTANNVNFKVCNSDQTNAVTPGAVTLNWRVTR